MGSQGFFAAQSPDGPSPRPLPGPAGDTEGSTAV